LLFFALHTKFFCVYYTRFTRNYYGASRPIINELFDFRNAAREIRLNPNEIFFESSSSSGDSTGQYSTCSARNCYGPSRSDRQLTSYSTTTVCSADDLYRNFLNNNRDWMFFISSGTLELVKRNQMRYSELLRIEINFFYFLLF